LSQKISNNFAKVQKSRDTGLKFSVGSSKHVTKNLQGSKAVFPPRKSYTEQVFVLVRMRNHVDSQPVKRVKC